MYKRQNELNQWIEQIIGNTQWRLTPLAGDASFRRYYRLILNNVSRVVMDAPPDKESIHSFIRIAHQLKKIGVRTPELLAVEQGQGFILLEDLGDNLLLGALTNDNVDKLYKNVMSTLLTIQQCDTPLPVFDKAHMLQELSLFQQWFLEADLLIQLSSEEKTIVDHTFDWLCTQIASQPQVFIHRDYHSRNLMMLDNTSTIAVIDFQDAMYGPDTYDLVSLLKDCYIQWPREKITYWLTHFYNHLPNTRHRSITAFIRDFDLCGLQRHLKVLGIFCRLHLRDNKTTYLRDLPLTFQYTMDCLESYSELHSFYQLMQERIAPIFLEKYHP